MPWEIRGGAVFIQIVYIFICPVYQHFIALTLMIEEYFHTSVAVNKSKKTS